MIITLQFTKGQNFVNNVDGAIVLDFCILSDHVLYLYQFS